MYALNLSPIIVKFLLGMIYLFFIYDIRDGMVRKTVSVVVSES